MQTDGHRFAPIGPGGVPNLEACEANNCGEKRATSSMVR